MKKNIIAKKIVIITLVMLLFVICFIPITYSKNTSNNNILYVGCNEIGCYPTIQSAIDASNKGDTIYVLDESSPYNENIVIPKSLNIIGENSETTIINGNGLNSVVYITSDMVNFTNFTIINGGNNPGIYLNSDNNFIYNCNINSNNIGIKCEYSKNNIISLSKIQYNTDNGIHMLDSSNNFINECLIENCNIGIKLDLDSKYNTIYGNYLRFNDNNIYLERSSFNNIYWNLITESIYGIFSKDSSSNVYTDNIIEKNEYGCYFNHASECKIKTDNIISENDKYGILIVDSENFHINENSIIDNEQGIIINDSSNSDIYWNNIKNNEVGINLYNTKKVNIYLNNISNNLDTGVLSIYSSSVKITYNNFIKNNGQSYFIQSSIFSFNSWKNNYWDDWDGRGSYRINGELNSFFILDSWYKLDRKPVSEPYNI